MNERSGLQPAALAFLLCLALAAGAGAQVHAYRTLTVQDGLAHSQVLSIAEDREGFLWFGTVDGVSRFDGLELVSFRKEDGLPGNEVRAIFQAPGGPLYFGTSGGLAIYENGRFTSGLGGANIRAIVGDADGSVFFGTDQGVVSLRPGGHYEHLPSGSGTPAPEIHALWMARDGKLYAGTEDDAVLLYKGNRLIRTLGPKDGLPERFSIEAIAEGRDGTIYLGTSHGLALYRDGAVLNSGRFLGPQTYVFAITVAPDGAVYFGTDLFGMFMLQPSSSLQSITLENGQTWSSVRAVHLTRAGTLYFGTERAVGVYAPGARIESWTRGTELHEETILSLAGDPAGGVYAGTGRGVAHYTAGRWQRLPPVSDQRHLIQALHVGSSGRLYAGNGRAEIRIYDHDRLVRTFGPRDGLEGVVLAIQETSDVIYAGTTSGLYAIQRGKVIWLWKGFVKAIAQAPGGTLYVGTKEGLILYRGGVVRRWTRREGLADDTVLSLRQGRGGSLYISTARGLSILRNDQLRTIDRRNGLSDDHISCVVEDGAGHLFLQTHRGINVIDPNAEPVVQEILTQDDGLALGKDNDGACDRDGTGRLWFGFDAGISAVHPHSGNPGRKPPRARFSGLELAGSKVPLPPAGQALSFENRQSLTISFLVIDLIAPRRIRYRYRFAGSDQGWSETALRSLHFPRLAPGNHTFEVQAANESGIWGEPARLRLRVTAPFYERAWFLPLLVLVLSGSGVAALAYRARSLLAIERLRTAIAADLHDQIGSGLTEIAILSELGELSRAAATARELTARMSDVVWLVNPRRDSLHQLFLRLKDSYADLFAHAGVLFRTVDLSAFERIHLPMSYRQNLYLIFKEALHNALRHGKCHEIELDVAVRGKQLYVTLRDDGRGFDPALTCESGDGLLNMQRRAATMGGRLALESSPGAGTTVRFTGPLR